MPDRQYWPITLHYFCFALRTGNRLRFRSLIRYKMHNCPLCSSLLCGRPFAIEFTIFANSLVLSPYRQRYLRLHWHLCQHWLRLRSGMVQPSRMAAIGLRVGFAVLTVWRHCERERPHARNGTITTIFILCRCSASFATADIERGDKVYVGVVGFKKPRSPYTRLREHLKMVKLWVSPASCRRCGCRAPGLYRAIAQVGIVNVIQVILAEATAEKLAVAECSFIRMLSSVFNVVGVSGHIALPRAMQRLCGSPLCEDVRIVEAQILHQNNPKILASGF